MHSAVKHMDVETRKEQCNETKNRKQRPLQ